MPCGIAFVIRPFTGRANAQCSQTVTVSANPQPVNGNYPYGQTVTFCTTVSGYNQLNANWLDGVSYAFGNGWDLSTITPVGQPTTAGGSGTWVWANSVTSTATGTTAGPGWFFDLNNDGNAGNDYGDNSSTATWVFCFSITTNATSANGINLDVSVNTWADGEIGSWSSFNCNNDPLFYPYPNGSTTLPTCTPYPVNVTTVDLTCAAPGSATATPAGGQAPYTYVWTMGGQPIQTNTAVNGPATANGLAVGSYTVVVTDAANCAIPVNFTITSQPFLTISAQTANASCTGICNGTATIVPQDATGPITYAWLPNVSSIDNSTTLCEGNYQVIATDQTGCADTVLFTIGVDYVVSTSVTSTNPTCYGLCNGTATITPQQGVAPYSHQWMPTMFNGGTNNALCESVYYITTTDVNGCFTIDTLTIVAPSELRVTASTLNETCPGVEDGTIELSIAGGVTPYSFTWPATYQGDSILSNVPGGSYQYTVTDYNGCELNGTATVNTDPQPIVNFYSNSTALEGFNTEVSFFDMSGTDVVGWNWDFDGMGNSTAQNPMFDFSSGGDYNVTLIATNANGCSDTLSQIITISPLQVLYIPKAFTPDNNGLNEVFKPLGVISSKYAYKLTVLNRWGQEIFTTLDIDKGWDGTYKSNETCPIDTYIYRIMITNRESGLSEEQIGIVNLIN